MATTPGISRTTEEWERELGRAIKSLRLQADRTQTDLARSADISVSTLQSLERGAGSSVRTLVAVVRALGRDDWIGALAPQVGISPMARLRAAQQAERAVRHRARGSGDRHGEGGS